MVFLAPPLVANTHDVAHTPHTHFVALTRRRLAIALTPRRLGQKWRHLF